MLDLLKGVDEDKVNKKEEWQSRGIVVNEVMGFSFGKYNSHF